MVLSAVYFDFACGAHNFCLKCSTEIGRASVGSAPGSVGASTLSYAFAAWVILGLASVIVLWSRL